MSNVCFVCTGPYIEHARLTIDLSWLAKRICVDCQAWVDAQSVLGHRTMNALMRGQYPTLASATGASDARLLSEKNIGAASVSWLRMVVLPPFRDVYLSELADVGVVPV